MRDLVASTTTTITPTEKAYYEQQVKDLKEQLTEMKNRHIRELKAWNDRLPEAYKLLSQIDDDNMSAVPPTKKIEISVESLATVSTVAPVPIVSRFPHQLWITTDQEERIPEMQTVAAVTQLHIQNACRGGGSPTTIASILEQLCDTTESCEDSRLVIARHGGIHGILTAMRGHTESACVQSWGCATLQNLLFESATNRAKVVSKGGIVTILNAMRGHSDPPSVQRRGCGVLMNLATGDSASRVKIACGIATILTAMRGHAGNSEVQHLGCGALDNIARVADNSALITSEGGIHCIITAMRQHEKSYGVQNYGCGALWNLSCHSSADRVQIASEGGIGAILNAMRGHEASSDVQLQGCGPLSNLALDADIAMKIASEGGIGAIITAMKRHERSIAVQEQACVALCHLTRSSRDNRIKIAEEEGGKRVLTALREYPDSRIIQEQGYNVLRRIWGLSDGSSLAQRTH